MISLYLDDILVVLHKATDVIKEIKAFYREKEGSIKPPDIYLGANIMKVQMPDGCEVCGFILKGLCEVCSNHGQMNV